MLLPDRSSKLYKTFWWAPIVIAVVIPLIAFFVPDRHAAKEMGSAAWALLLLVLAIRPLWQIFPKCRIFGWLMGFRRPIGIVMGALALTHSVVLFPPVQFVSDPQFWSVENGLLWGGIAALFLIPPLVTSSNFAMRVLKTAWKGVQRLVYPAFFATAAHIALLEDEWIGVAVPTIAIAILWLLAAKKIVFWK